MRNYLTERIMKKEYYEGAGECPECMDKLPVNTEKEREEKKKILRHLLAKAAQGNYDEENYREGDLLPEEEYCRYLEEDGSFSDLPGSTESILEAFARLACITERHHWRKGLPWESGERKETVLKAIIKYGRMEIEREDKGVCRFHKSLFYLPKTSVSMCFALYPDFMDAQERPEKQAPLVTEAMEVLLRVIFQCWQLPLRNNHTDAHPICVDRFRGHVWWIGANGITYRPVFYAAVLLCTPENCATIIIMFIMATGNVIQDDFDQIYNMLNAKVMDVGDVIGTYTYRMGIEKMNFSYATAVGLFKNVVSLILVTFTNAFSRKLSGSSLW